MKKRMPVQMWQKIQPVIDQHRQLVVPVRSEIHGFYLDDVDQSSDFFFACNFQDGNGKYEIARKPVHAGYVIAVTDLVDLDGLETQLITWLKVLESYSTISTIYDDSILRSYEEEFATYFEMVSEDADNVSFDMERQLLLEQYLDRAVSRLETEKKSANEQQKAELNEIISEVESLKTNRV